MRKKVKKARKIPSKIERTKNEKEREKVGDSYTSNTERETRRRHVLGGGGGTYLYQG